MAADIEAALVGFLKADAGVSALVANRIYPENAIEKAGYPRIVYSLSGTDEQRSTKGSADQPNQTFEVDCYAEGSAGAGGNAAAKALAEAVQDATGAVADGQALKSFGPAWMPAAGAPGAVWVKQVRLQDAQGGQPEQGAGGDRKWIHNRRLTLVVGYNRQTF